MRCIDNHDAAKNWYLITLYPTANNVPRWDWCDEHKSNGKFYCQWAWQGNHREEWFFEHKEDALIFALSWGN